jgi:DNA-binding response OmpR family regulator
MKNKILIIDDDTDILDALEILLTKSGFDVAICKDGTCAEQKTSEHTPDVVLLDVLLSGVNGLDICKTLKNNPLLKHTPIIMISAHPSAEALSKSCGANGFIAKPFTAQKLLEEIRKFTN